MEPVLLPANQPPGRFYAGGEAIAAFRHDPPASPNTPEDWVGSTTSVRGKAPEGMTRLPAGELLAQAIEADPLAYLGPDHVAVFGSDTKLLVKLLDAGQRLPVHAHPDGDFARRHVGAAHGKAEAWYILSAGVVHLGLKRDVPAHELAELVAGQHTDTLLGLLHEIAVEPNDTVYVPPGVLHAIGRGILLAEVQEPEDLSILLEWAGFGLDGKADGHLDLGFELALQAVETRERPSDEALALVRRAVPDGPVLVPEAERYFRLDRVSGRRQLPASFAIVLAVRGASQLVPETGPSLALPAGSTALVPFAAGSVRVETDGMVLVARPPAVSCTSQNLEGTRADRDEVR